MDSLEWEDKCGAKIKDGMDNLVERSVAQKDTQWSKEKSCVRNLFDLYPCIKLLYPTPFGTLGETLSLPPRQNENTQKE